jgi:hypothetical protein
MTVMTDGAKIREFWAHWQHELNPTKEFKRFRARVFEVARQQWRSNFRDSSSLRERFAVLSGTRASPYPGFEQSGLCAMIQSATSVFEVAEAGQYLVWTLEGTQFGIFEHCCRELQEAFDLSPGVSIRLVNSGKRVTIFPSGAELLDESVIEANLIWLTRYPDVLKAFQEALRLYMAKDPKQYRNMLDNLRFALEQMLCAVLGNQKTLENQKEEFLQWLKLHDVHSQIRNMYHTLLFGGFTKYQNDAVKHQEDEYTAAEVEFVLYATGTFLRLIQRILEQKEATAQRPNVDSRQIL